MDSYNIFFEAVAGNPEEERDTITKMTMALWNHTDGRETKHFLNRWFDELLKIDSKYAIAFLSGLQIKFGKSWVVEGMLRSAIKKYSNDLDCLDIVIGLIESLPNDTSPRIIDASTSVFRTLEQIYTGADDDERLLIKRRMNELVINVVSRFNILDSPWPDNNSWKDGNIKEFLLTVESSGFDVSQYIEYFHIKKANDMENKEVKKTVDVFETNQTRFEALTTEDAKKWFETHDLIERDVQDICRFLRNYQNDKDSLLEIMRFIITEYGGWRYSKKRKDRDPIMQVVDTCGIDYVELYERLHASSRLNNKIRAFVGGGSKMPETNTLYKSYVIQYALHAIIEKAYRDRKPELIPQNLFRLIPDYQGIYRLFKCREIQPRNHLYDKSNSCVPFLKNNEEEYILIGCYETRTRIDYHQASFTFAYQGIVGDGNEENQIPFRQYLAPAVGKGETYMISDNSESLINIIRTFDRELEDEDYLWPSISISKLFNIHMEFDFLNGRYIAVNQDNDIVFIMKKWSSSYKGDSEYPGNAIPLYSGTELYIKKEYIEMLEKQFGTLMMKTYVKSYTQTY